MISDSHHSFAIRPVRTALSATVLLALVVCPCRSGESVDFESQVFPLLKSRCVACHGGKKVEGGLRLDIRRLALRGGDSGVAIRPRSPADSELIARLTTADKDLRMPLGGDPLSTEQIALLRSWIEQGARWPDRLAGVDRALEHWAFQPVRRPDVPRRLAASSSNATDAFIRRQLEKHGLSFSVRADPRTLIRRLSLDLIGLPPSPEDIDEFVNDQRPDAYERLVDRLLASPHFGERWGRHWLDLARFAESDGYENDRLRPHAWRFRDWVVQALNDDLTFDQFTIDQLAGDLLPEPTEAQLVATGFHRNTLWNSAASADKEEFRVRAVKDRANTTATVWMGLTLACCQCHSHKYDPISQREYYQVFAFFNRTDNADVRLSFGAASTLKVAMRASHVHRRGNFLDRGPEVAPGTPSFLPELSARNKEADRLDLAQWLVEPRHPLTARVAVNRFWQHLFGRGLIPTPENLGRNGEPPSHPKLLDWLASEFMRRDWSRKSLLRTIVLSKAYRQSSRTLSDDSIAVRLDPENRLLWRQNRVRVEAETVRDLALSVGGLLNERIGGESFVPPFPDGLLEHKLTNETLRRPGGERYRRALYIHVQRTFTFPSLAVFDAADGNEPCIRRDRSTTPMQALTLLNDPVFQECSKALGKRLQSLRDSDDFRLEQAFLLCSSRRPDAEEKRIMRELIQRQRELGASQETVWRGIARTMLNTESFVTRE